jgi:phosphatidylserine synthase 2
MARQRAASKGASSATKVKSPGGGSSAIVASPPGSPSVANKGDPSSFHYTASYGSKEPLSTPHTVTVLLLLVALIVYAAFGEQIEEKTGLIPKDPYFNIKRGIFGALFVGLVFCAEHLRDTLFIRPHPAVWRFATGVGLFYTMFCTYLLFQNVNDVRALMPHLDPKVTGKKLAERSYGEACELTWSNVRGGIDEFVIAHLLGWVFKHMMLRDIKLSMALSLLFELMEYTFEFLQPNFIE